MCGARLRKPQPSMFLIMQESGVTPRLSLSSNTPGGAPHIKVIWYSSSSLQYLITLCPGMNPVSYLPQAGLGKSQDFPNSVFMSDVQRNPSVENSLQQQKHELSSPSSKKDHERDGKPAPSVAVPSQWTTAIAHGLE